MSDSVLSTLLMDQPEIIVGTPGKLLDLLQTKINSISLNELKFLVVDEVDLVLTFGYQDDLNKIGEYLPLKKKFTNIFDECNPK